MSITSREETGFGAPKIVAHQGCSCPICRGQVDEGGPSGPSSYALNANDRGEVTLNNKPSFDPNEAAIQLTRSGLSWAPALGQATTVTFAFRANAPATLPESVESFSRFNEMQIAATLQALKAWSDVANITFSRVTEDGTYGDNATILFGNYTTSETGSAGFAYFPGSRAVTSASGDIWINYSLSYNSAPVGLAYGPHVLAHEIGHSIGLSHPASYNAAPDVTITYAADATYYEDSRQYTIMSYFSERETGGSFVANGQRLYAAGPQIDDIAAAQRLYGANMSTRTGDTVYGFNSSAGPAFLAVAGSGVVFAVWDAGGVDTFDFSGYGQNQIIDLRAGSFSNVGGLQGNVAIAVGVVIENAVGGSGNDTLQGNGADNILIGGAGNDRMFGGLGTDTILFGGNLADYSISYQNGIGTIVGPDGTDTFSEVEFLQFADMRIGSAAGGGGFDGLRYIAGYADLRAALGANAQAGADHYARFGQAEGRSPTAFDPLAYVAGHADLIRVIGTDTARASEHYIMFGANEGRALGTFNAGTYAASNVDLARIIGLDSDAAARHYIEYGYAEGRATSGFDALRYSASHADLARAFGTDAGAAQTHYLNYGADEGRAVDSFDARIYSATHLDLARTVGTDGVSATLHYLQYGVNEERAVNGFDPVAYLLSHADLGGLTPDAALNHWLTFGADEGRVGDGLFGREQTTHVLVGGQAFGSITGGIDRDWFTMPVTVGQCITIDLVGSGGGRGTLQDGAISVYDALGRLVAFDSDGGAGLDASLTLTVATSGSYYFVVTGERGATGSYVVQATVSAGADLVTDVGTSDVADVVDEFIFPDEGIHDQQMVAVLTASSALPRSNGGAHPYAVDLEPLLGLFSPRIGSLIVDGSDTGTWDDWRCGTSAQDPSM